ncbi:MAG: hypothetical protein C4293_22075 [Nitrospiraceae bacterium]
MNLLQRMKHDLRTGVAKLRYGTVQAAKRALEETELLQLRLEVRKLDSRIKELCRDIGERAVELHERGESSQVIVSDQEITRGVEQVLALKAERAKLLAEMEEVRSSGEDVRR